MSFVSDQIIVIYLYLELMKWNCAIKMGHKIHSYAGGDSGSIIFLYVLFISRESIKYGFFMAGLRILNIIKHWAVFITRQPKSILYILKLDTK